MIGCRHMVPFDQPEAALVRLYALIHIFPLTMVL